MISRRNKTITFLNLAAQSPSLELALGVSDKIQSELNSNHIFYICDSAQKSCSVNIKNKKSICSLCIKKAQIGVDLYKRKNKNVEVKYISRKDLITGQKKFSNLINEDIELGVNSTIASQFRISKMEQLDSKWEFYRRKMLESSFGLYNYFSNQLSLENPKSIIVFNGRLSCARPLKVLAESKKIDYYLFDASYNGNFPILAKNQMFHSLEFARYNSILTYLKNFKKSKETARSFMNAKLMNQPVNDKVYTSHQKKSFINPIIFKNQKKIISIFTSSDDEYKYIGSDWENYKILDQVEEIIKLKNLTSEYNIVVKMHPNQKNIHKSSKSDFKNLSKSITVLDPLDKTDTYELIRISEYVITFCSSVGIEANYLRKRVIQIGPSIFMKLPAVNYVKDAKDCFKLINNNKAKIMPLRASIIWFNYLSFPNCNLDTYKTNYNGKFYYNNQQIKVPLSIKIKSLIDKIIFNIEKGNFDFITNFMLYLTNFIYGENKVK